MRYFKLLSDDECASDIVASYKEMFGIGHYDVITGMPLLKWHENFTFLYDPDKGDIPTDYLINNLGWFVVSQELKDIIEQLNCKIEFRHVNVVNQKDMSALAGYYVANIIDLVDALDLNQSDHSVYKTKGIEVIAVRRYALKKDKLEGKHIIKLLGDEIPMFVSEKFKEMVEANGLTGCDFLEVKVI